MIYIIQTGSKYYVLDGKALGQARGKGAFFEVQLDGLSALIKRFRDKDVAVLGQFSTMVSELLITPKIPKKLERNVIQREIGKRVSEISNPVFNFNLISETVIEGRTQNSYFVAVLDHNEIAPLLTEIIKAKKNCKYISSLPIILANLLQDMADQEPSIFVCDFSTEKVHILFLNKKIAFIRIATSDGQGFLENDLENIFQTIAYCRETLRVFPVKLYYLTQSKDRIPEGFRGLEVRYIELPSKETQFELGYLNYYVLTNLNQDLKRFLHLNFIPEPYKVLRAKKMVAAYMGLALLISILLSMTSTGLKSYEIAMERSHLRTLEVQLINQKFIFDEYKKARDRLDKVLPAIEFHNSMLKQLDTSTIIEKTNQIVSDVVKISQVYIKKETETVLLIVHGIINIPYNAEAYVQFNNMVESIQKISNIQIDNRNFDIKNKTFSLTMRVAQ